MILGALVAAAAVLLVVAGLAKLRTPDPAATMIRSFLPRLPGRVVARSAGIIEICAGSAALVWDDRVALVALAGCYLALLAVAVLLATRPQRAACGCFGAADGEVGVAHILLDACCLAVAGWAVVVPPGAIGALFHEGALTGGIAVAQALLLACLGYLSITALPALSSARRSVEAAR